MKRLGLFLSLILVVCGLAFAQNGVFDAADESFAGFKELSPAGETLGIPTPTLGTYSSTNLLLSGNGTVTPSAAPTNTTYTTATTSSDFKGLLEVNPATGVVRVTNAHPAGIYNVRVRAVGAGGSATRTFTLSVSTPTGCGSFGTSAFSRADYAVGISPNSVAVGDFNGDGRQDIVATNGSPGQNSVSVLLRNVANDGFEPKVDYPAGTRPIALAVGDLNGDGRQDIVVGNNTTSTASVIFRNAANNGFDAPVSLSTPNTVNALAVGDLNGDGLADFVAGIGSTSTTISVFLRNAANTGFEPRLDLTATFGINSVAIADFNGDGKADIGSATASGLALFLYRNAANTGFDPAVNVSLPATTSFIMAAGDYNGDGRQDFAVGFNNNFVSVYLRNAANDGFTQEGNLTTAGTSNFGLASGDFNHDGKQDIVYSSRTANVSGVFLRNSANTGFEPKVDFAAGSGTRIIAVGDFNGDNRQDVVTANQDVNNVSVLTRVCDSIPPDTTIQTTPSNPSNSSSATFTFAGTDDVSLPTALTFECSLDNAAFSACTSPQIYSGLSDGNRIFAVRAKDQAGNADPTPATFNWMIDTIAPTISLSTAATSPATSAFSVTALFSESVSGFDLSDIAVVNGSAGNLAGSGSAFTFTVTPTAAGLVTVTIAAGAAQDAAGNNNAFTGPLSMVFSNPLPLVVTKTADTNDGVCDADCSLREAVAAANASAGDESITFNIPNSDSGCVSGVCTITLTSGEIAIANAATAGVLFIRNTNGTRDNLLISGNNNSRIFNVAGGGNLTLDGVTVTRGRTATGQANGGAITNAGSLKILNSAVTDSSASVSSNGGGLSNTGELIIDKTIVARNSATLTSGGFFNNGGTATVTNSAVTGNNASIGGCAFNDGQMNLTNSTLSGNSAGSPGQGGCIYNNNGGTVNLTNITITANAGNAIGSTGGGIRNNGSGIVRARNTIISGNAAFINPDLDGPLAVNENNLIGGNALLAPLGFYGSTTQSHALLSGSTAINAGNNCVLTMSCTTFNAPMPLTTDQRGAARVGNVDIGAFEANSSANGGTFRATLPDGRLNSPYSFVLVPSNGTTTYAVTGGALPPGTNLTTALAPNAVVSLTGTPTTGGVFNFSITATNGGNMSVTDYSLNIVVPTAAGVSVSGRVMTSDGRGLRNATVTMTDASGVTRSARTGTFGYYRFDDVGSGQVMTFNVKTKRANFAPQVVYIGDSITDLDFVEGGF